MKIHDTTFGYAVIALFICSMGVTTLLNEHLDGSIFFGFLACLACFTGLTFMMSFFKDEIIHNMKNKGE